uniref:Uncharacterized protein n=1 Tax=Ananas comosus var. bracteatus TaxID=296719 RepID=A0A6V7PDS2_ANACO|nr:unnamed protein product [Ananas comosus var. bracteatus]
MASSSPRFLHLVLYAAIHVILKSAILGDSRCPLLPPSRKSEAKFQQKTSKFWEFEEKSNTWVEITLPFDLISCVNSTCTKVGSIDSVSNEQSQVSVQHERGGDERIDNSEPVLPIRRRISLTRMSEASVWVTGQSGSIYERFWNGVQWVIAPHELQTEAGYAVSTFVVNQTILALSEVGILYQLQLNEKSQPIWTELVFKSEQQSTSTDETEPSRIVRVKSGVVSCDGKRLLLSTMNGSLIEIIEFQPLRWDNYGRPPGGDVSAVADIGNIRPGILFTISSAGDLYEFDKNSKPSWKKHIWSEASMKENSLRPSAGCTLHNIVGAQSVSLFLITKDGFLVERRLHRRKWKWAVHGAPNNQRLSAITPIQLNKLHGKNSSLFLTTTTGRVFEYRLIKHSGGTHSNKMEGQWINHKFPGQAKVARGVPGVEIQIGRLIFPLDDGRLGELHFPGIGGDDSGPAHISSIRRKASNKYEWSILDAPETEGWNAEYCTEERGLANCILGINNVVDNSETNMLRRRKGDEQENYVPLSNQESDGIENHNFLTRSIYLNFRMRVLHADRSLFLVTESGITFEYLYTDNVWLWLRHEHTTAMRGLLGSYNGSLFLVDVNGYLLIRERNGDELSWINCTAMKKGRQVASGPPWDGIPGRSRRVTVEDAIFFVNKKGRLIQFTVALRKFKWKDCQSPPDTRIAFIVDQEVFRMNIVFVVGRNGRLYQYNRITELWHKHRQSPHLVLSRNPGTAARPSLQSLSGSIFMISESGGLVEYHWSSQDGWEWVEHGTPYRDVTLVGAPGPCFDGTQLFVIGSDGNVYRRHSDGRTWKWTSHGHPNEQNSDSEGGQETRDGRVCAVGDPMPENYEAYYSNSFAGNCNEKVAPIRPIPFSENSVIFELQDGRLAELRRPEEAGDWGWARIVGTPTSPCLTSYWTAVAA